ncbi:NUDIX domain-containing protein [Asaia bogorensis]|uniref:NUDIX domain-containing protein n=1 Tax=Asaia bogorensis TaxID=91915 RepID=UPI002864FBFB|nr:NUDIX domain-containing protein [Asaia bogorensis]MDR6181415.1 ADP-sugar diphosphatase [Asaia bogorensis NBRC 16594]
MVLAFASHIPQDWHDAIANAPHVRRWIEGVECEFEVSSLTIRDAVKFGSRIGFVFAEAQAHHEGVSVPRYAFLRGDSVGILVVLRHPDHPPRTVLTCEPRLPIATAESLSLPAGMVDDGTVQSTALREFAEETGISLALAEQDLISLGTVTLSPGGCDEHLTLYALEIDLEPSKLTSLDNRATGLESEHEHIRLRVLPLAAIPTLPQQDAKLLLAFHLYGARTRD